LVLRLALNRVFFPQEKEPPATPASFPVARAANPDAGFSKETGEVKRLSLEEKTGEGEHK
jgi:hypothetical protein